MPRVVFTRAQKLVRMGARKDGEVAWDLFAVLTVRSSA